MTTYSLTPTSHVPRDVMLKYAKRLTRVIQGGGDERKSMIRRQISYVIRTDQRNVTYGHKGNRENNTSAGNFNIGLFYLSSV